MDCGERGSVNGLLATAFLLTKNVPPQAVTGIGSDLATCPSAVTGVTLTDVFFNSRPHGGHWSASLRRCFRSGPSNLLPCQGHRLLESQRSLDRFVVDVVGDADRRLLVVGSCMVIAPAHEPNPASLALAIAKVRLGIEAAPMHAELQPGARLGGRNLSFRECLRHASTCGVVEYPSNKRRRTTPNSDERLSVK